MFFVFVFGLWKVEELLLEGGAGEANRAVLPGGIYLLVKIVDLVEQEAEAKAWWR